MDNKQHWDNVYASKQSEDLTWYQQHERISLDIIKNVAPNITSNIIDIGGGSSTLIDDLLNTGYRNLSVLDLSSEALSTSKKRLAERNSVISWIEADITKVELPKNYYDVWHDRAVFHFLTQQQDREAYVDRVNNSVKPGGYVIVATFGSDGPLKCSGLPVVRYDSKELHNEFGNGYKLIDHIEEEHLTPKGAIQKFIYCYCKKLR